MASKKKGKEADKVRAYKVTPDNIRLLKAFLDGTWLRPRISNEMRARAVKELGTTAPEVFLKKLEDAGIIIGYVPLLSENAKVVIRGFDALEQLGKNGNSEPMEEIFGGE